MSVVCGVLSIQFEGEPCSCTPRNLLIVVDNFVLFDLLDGLNSFFRWYFNVFFAQLTIRVLCFTKIMALPHRTFFSFFIKNNVPVLLPSSPFFRHACASYCLICSSVRPCSDKFVRYFCVFTPPFKNSLAMTMICVFWLSSSYHVVIVTLFYAMVDRASLRDWFFFITYPGIDHESICLCWIVDSFSVGCKHFPHVQYTMPISPIQGAIWTLSLRRSLVELEDLGIAHFSSQIF